MNLPPAAPPPLGLSPPRRRSFLAAGVVAVLVSFVAAPGIDAGLVSQGADPRRNWPQWRGPLQNGVAPESDPPLLFDAESGVRWRAAIPGRGRSSPIVWEDLVFVTTAIPLDQGDPRERPRRRRRRLAPHEFRLIAVDRRDGDIRWSRLAITATPHEGFHRTFSSFANASPVTDGERVYAFFGSRGLYAYDFEGALVWSRDFGVEMQTFGQFGEASSPALYSDTIVVLFDHQEQSFIAALDKRTGETRWKQLRDEETSWTSPLVVEDGGQSQVITSAGNFITAYDLTSGRVLWRSAGMTQHPIPTPVAGNGLVFAASGSSERRVRAVRLGSSGDLSDSDAIAWTLDKAAPYNPSPMLWDTELYLVRDGGMNAGTSRLSVLDAATGAPHYLQVRLPGDYSIKASPVGAAGRVYLVSEEGDVIVLRRGPRFEILAINPMREKLVASPAIAHDELFLRSASALICVSGSGR